MNEELLLRMIKYLHNFKKYDIDLLGNFKFFEKSKIPSNITPEESVCIDCQTPLSNPVKVCDNVRVFTMQGMVTGFKSYVKKCSICELYYRYQGWNYGIHNYNDRLFLGFDVCLYLKEHLYHHNSILSFSESMNSLFNLSVPSGDIVKAYILFEALLNNLYSFYCNSCGYYPWILVMDLNKKIAFKCAFEELEDGEEPKDTVHCDKFWENVELNAIANAFPDREIKSLETKPRLNCWSPYSWKATRHGNNLLNTEFKKVNKSTGKLEADCRFMTEERILEMLSSEKLKKVKSVAKSCNIATKGSKLDILLKIKEVINKNDAKSKKVFSKLWGHSGGWLSFSCPHGIVYYLKFLLRAESCRDYIDGLLSLKHEPNIVIVDMAHIVANHANNTRKEDNRKYGKADEEGRLFFPCEGHVSSSDDSEYIRLSRGNLLEVNFLWMSTTNEPLTKIEGNVHPITGSDVHLCLFDRLHEGNSSSDIEYLRRINNIPQLNSVANSQVQEQLHLRFDKNKSFLNMMKPANHIFLF